MTSFKPISDSVVPITNDEISTIGASIANRKRKTDSMDKYGHHPDTRKLQKNKRRSKNNTNDKTVFFKSIIPQKDNWDNNSINKPFPEESNFLSWYHITFYPHQVEALRWMNYIETESRPKPTLSQSTHSRSTNHNTAVRHSGGVLADVMGLGKTISCLGMVALDRYLENGGMSLAIAPLSLLHNWEKEAVVLMKLPQEGVFVYHGTDRMKLLSEVEAVHGKPFLIITTHETVQKDFSKRESSPLYTRRWKRVFLDEAHIARNPKTKTFQALQSFDTCALYCVTGTPIVNYPKDVRQLSLLCTPLTPLVCGNLIREENWKSKYMLRRTKQMLGIPAKTNVVSWVEFTEEERRQYGELEKWAHITYKDLTVRCNINRCYQKILYILVRLRQGCDHSWLRYGHPQTSSVLLVSQRKAGIEVSTPKKRKITPSPALSSRPISTAEVPSNLAPEKEKENGNKTTGVDGGGEQPVVDVGEQLVIDVDNECLSFDNKVVLVEEVEMNDGMVPPSLELFAYSSKMRELIRILKKTRSEHPGEKTVVFSQFTTMLDLVESSLIDEGFMYSRFDGKQQNSRLRVQSINRFIEDPECTILIASLKAGGVGLNLTCANHLVLIEPWWNLPVEEQAEDRVHRIGQTKPVTVTRLFVKDSIEEDILKIQKKKQGHESCFYDAGADRILSIKDIDSMFDTMKNRQLMFGKPQNSGNKC